MHEELQTRVGKTGFRKVIKPAVFRVFAAMIVLTATISSAHAILIELDLTAKDDRLLTLDKVSGLEWLDVTATTGLTYNQARASDFVTVQGFRHATLSEVSALHTNLGFLPQTAPELNDPFVYAPYYNYDFAQELISKLGCTEICSDSTFSFQSGLVEGLPTDPLNALAVSVQTDTVTAPWGFFNVPFNQAFRFDKATFQLPNFGHYLVRVNSGSIPEPSSWLFMIFGITILVGYNCFGNRRSKKQSSSVT